MRTDDCGADDEHKPERGEDAEYTSPKELDDVGGRTRLRDQVARDREESDDGEPADALLPARPPETRIRAEPTERERVVENDHGRQHETNHSERVPVAG